MTQEKHQPAHQPRQTPLSVDRRRFLASTAALGAMPLLSDVIGETALAQDSAPTTGALKSIIGGYGSWAAGLATDPPQLSFRNDRWKDVEAWRAEDRLIGSQ